MVSIGRYAFTLCDALQNVSLTAGVTTLGDDAFLLCSHNIQFTLRVRPRVLLPYDWTHYNNRMLFFTLDLFYDFLSMRELGLMTRVSKSFYSFIVTRSRHNIIFDRLGQANSGSDDDENCLAILCSSEADIRSCITNAVDEI